MKLIDLFSGIGGFSLGFQQAGYQFTEHYFLEINKSAIANYKNNFPNAKYIGDITSIHGGDFTGIDIITFGSPCQDFSLAGRSVPGVFPIREDDCLFATKTQSQFQSKISGTIKANGNMNADDTYIIPKTASTLTGGGHSGGLHSDMTVIQLNPSTESNGRQPYQQNRVYDERGISPALTRNNNDFIIKQRSRGKNKGADLKICPTISSNAFQENNLLCGVRRLTEIECERLQGFPDNWTQYGNYNGRIRRISKTKRYQLIGNAVTVNIVELIAKRLKITRNE